MDGLPKFAYDFIQDDQGLTLPAFLAADINTIAKNYMDSHAPWKSLEECKNIVCNWKLTVLERLSEQNHTPRKITNRWATSDKKGVVDQSVVPTDGVVGATMNRLPASPTVVRPLLPKPSSSLDSTKKGKKTKCTVCKRFSLQILQKFEFFSHLSSAVLISPSSTFALICVV